MPLNQESLNAQRKNPHGNSDPLTEKKKPRKKAKKKSDPTWSKHGHGNRPGGNIANLRSDTKKTVGPNNTPIKTTIRINKEFLHRNHLNTPQRLQLENDLETRFKEKIPGFVTANSDRNEPGTPVKLHTPEKNSVLYRIQRTDELSFYSNDLSHSPIKFQKKQTAADKSPVKKIQQLHLTAKKIQKEKQRRQRDGIQRFPSQEKVMGNSAKDHLKEKNVFTDVPVEWLHLIAFSLIGNEAQRKENLVAGTAHANTAMLIGIEKHIKQVVNHYKTVDITVEATLKKGTEIAETIYYEIKAAPDFEFTITFDAENKIKPHISLNDYMRELIDALIEIKTKLIVPPPLSPSSPHSPKLITNSTQSLFYTKPMDMTFNKLPIAASIPISPKKKGQT